MKNFCIENKQLYLQTADGEGETVTFSQMSEAFAKSLNRLEEIHHISGNALAKLIGISQQTLNLYENNKRTPNFVTAMQIAIAFGVTIEDMILDGLDLLEPDLETISKYPQFLHN